MRSWTGGHSAWRTPVSYVRNEPASLRRPRPRPRLEDSGVTQADRHLPRGGFVSLSAPLPVLASAAELAGPRLAPRPGDCWPGEQVASGFGQSLSPAAGRPELEVGVWEFPPWRLLLP